MRNRCLAVLAISGFLGAVGCQCQPPPTASYCAEGEACATRYLAFQVFSSQRDPHIPIGSEETLRGTTDRETLSTFCRELVDSVGERGSDGTRLALVFGPITWDQDDDTVRALIDNAFAVGEELDIAVGFHIDDSMYWRARQDLRTDDNIEWSSWDGDVTTRRYVFWALGSEMAPQLCYGSPVLRAEATRRAHDVIGTAIAAHLDDLNEVDRAARFAGVVAGWETHMPDYRYSKLDAATRKQMETDNAPFARLGFCSLTWAGFTAEAPPQDMDAALEDVVRDWLSVWTDGLAAAGIPRDAIYTHIAHPVDRRYWRADEIKRRDDIVALDEPFSVSAMSGYAAPQTAFNDTSRPGFSVYPVGFDADDTNHRDAMFQTIYDAVGERGDPWAVSEGVNMGLMFSTYTQEQYLAAAFNHGATLVNIFGPGIGGGLLDLSWMVPPWFTASSNNPGAMEAYRKFLRGEKLLEDGE